MSCKIRWEHKNIFKVLSILLVATIVVGFKVGFNLKTQAAEVTEPSFSISDLEYTPSNPKVGEDITVTGEIIPNDFVTSVPENDIVLVLDVSGSMKENIWVKCEKGTRGSVTGDYCIECNDFVAPNHNDEQPYKRHDVDRRGNCQQCDENVGISEKEHRLQKPYSNHTIKHDYCAVQRSKLTELKNAANNFIDKMKSVSNLKIGIVAYSSNASIKTNPKGNGMLSSSNSDELKRAINALSADGGTNSGEGIRKALYILNKSQSNGKKSIVFMSDGEPTYYSKNWNGSYYTGFDNNNNPSIDGGGNDDPDIKSLKYAMIMGNLVSTKSINAFTVGYGLDANGNKKMQAIQASMLGNLKSDDITTNDSRSGKNINATDSNNENKLNSISEKDGFFATSDNAIDGVFSIIADKILNEYPIKNVQLNLNMNENFSLNIGGNVVSLSNITYKLKEQNGNKLTYSAEPVPFSFRIKANEKGDYKDIFNGSKIFIPWNDTTTIKLDIGKTDINVSSSGTPIIKARLDTESFNGNGPFNVNYTIIPDKFQLDNDSNSTVVYDETAVKDVAVLVDESIPKDQVYNSIVNNILSDSYFTDRDTRYSFIVYGKNGYKYYKLDDYFNAVQEIKNAYNNMGTDNKENNKNYASAIKALVGEISKELGKESADSYIKSALDKSIELLNGGRKESFTEQMDKGRNELINNKNIVILGRGNISDIGQIDKVNSDYKVITFNYGKINSSTKDADNNIRTLHYKLIGKEMKNSILDKKADYYYLNMDYNKYINNKYNDSNDSSFFTDSNNIGGSTGEEKNNIQNSIMGNIKEDLKNGNTNIQQIENEYEFKVKLKFQVGQDILADGLNNSDSPYDKESSEILVKYTLDKSDGYYKAPEQQITFSIKANVNDSNKSKSRLTFGTTNKIVYKGLGNEDMDDDMDTPIINMYKPKHGVYLKDDSGESYSIDESKHAFPKNSFGTFAAEIKYANNGDSIKLTLPDGVELANGDPEIWKVVNGKLSKTELTLSEDGKSYSGSINNVFSENNDDNTILVIYTVKMPVNEITQLSNKITVNNGQEADAIFEVKDELPDLF